MKKILILANSVGGLYHFRKELLEQLVQQYEVYFCVPDGSYVEIIEKMGCKHVPCNFNRLGTNPLKEWKLLNDYLKILKTVRPDMVFTYTIKPNVYGGMACALAGVPYVANITGLGTAVENPGKMQKLAIFLYKCGLRKAQKVFFQNSENRDFMLKHKVVRGAYDLLPGSGVNLQQYEPIEYPNNETIDFLFVGRIMAEKGVNQYFDAAKYITQKYPNTRFHVCGSFQQNYAETVKQLQEAGTIIYHGQVKDMKSMYGLASCTIHPTYYPEGLSNVLLESSASARPIITTNRSGCREVIDDGINGFVVNQRDSQDLIEKVERFLNLSWEERKAMGLAGRAKVEKEFDRQIVVRKYLKEIH